VEPGNRVAGASHYPLARGVPFLLVTDYASRIGEQAIVRAAPRLGKPFSFQA
jgi:hypothetical protein